MPTLAEQHFNKTKCLLESVDKDKIATWLLKDGYYPEQYVFPPCFHVQQFNLNSEPYYQVIEGKSGKNRFRPTRAELLNVSYPKSLLTDRIFGIIEPKIYHDIVWYLNKEFDNIVNHLFSQDTRFYCYSFPIPLSKNGNGELGSLRSGRMIYEFIEMAENDLVADAHHYQYLVQTDIKNFYPSIYTHSIAWALHEKEPSRNDTDLFSMLGTKLDKLFQNSNDGCTNGLAIGPAISDIVAEIILSAIDRKCSEELGNEEFLGVRFKDDYRILCKDRNVADKLIKNIQRQMRYFNLYLNENKTTIKELPNGLFRPWILEYQPFSLKEKSSISYKTFETTLLAVLGIDAKYPDTGIIEKFLSELTTKDNKLKLDLTRKQIFKALSLFLLLKKRRAKSFPQILAIIELMIEKNDRNKDVVYMITEDIRNYIQDNTDYLYDDLWIYYFLKSQGHDISETKNLESNPLFHSIRSNKQDFFLNGNEINLFKPIEAPGYNKLLIEYIAIYPKDESESI
jgi:hypothetical protein